MGVTISQGGGFPEPIVSVFSKNVNINSTSTIVLKGSYLTPDTKIEVEGQVIENIIFISSSEINFDITTNNQESDYDVKVTNEGGEIIIPNAITIRESNWTDLRLNGDNLNIGSDIRVFSGVTVDRDNEGMSFTGGSLWSTWAKFEVLGFSRGDNKTVQWIFTRPSEAMMIGIGSTATNENNNSQWQQAELLCYINSPTNVNSLFGNDGTVGTLGNQQQINTNISGGSGVFKAVFTNDGGENGEFTLYEIPSVNESDWENTSNERVSTFTITKTPDESNLMPFVIMSGINTMKLIALKAD